MTQSQKWSKILAGNDFKKEHLAKKHCVYLTQQFQKHRRYYKKRTPSSGNIHLKMNHSLSSLIEKFFHYDHLDLASKICGLTTKKAAVKTEISLKSFNHWNWKFVAWLSSKQFLKWSFKKVLRIWKEMKKLGK